ncbi:hypothetical protein H6P81_018721 [Aristolochia fimbriata]|uniref:Uncharacterized protein n=1 Tax=Aristolochia fimbriata TaxID=158543 RepID=A0AAV7E237_ARIFI|nr:hypothetical protein H6P81_018721 [Aristolochia fimbriata]
MANCAEAGTQGEDEKDGDDEHEEMEAGHGVVELLSVVHVVGEGEEEEHDAEEE